jgi:hypothetical protein
LVGTARCTNIAGLPRRRADTASALMHVLVTDAARKGIPERALHESFWQTFKLAHGLAFWATVGSSLDDKQSG